MNKRLQKKKASRTAGMTRNQMREKINILHDANDILIIGIQGIKEDKDALEDRLRECKLVHMNDFAKKEKDICKLKAQNKSLSDTVTELRVSLADAYIENSQLQVELLQFKKRTLFERIFNKVANDL